MGRRTVLISVALLVAALGTSLVFLYVRGVDERAQAHQDPVSVLVAKDRVPAGTAVKEAQLKGIFQLRAVPRTGVVPGALSNVASILDKIALSDVYPGEQILPGRFGAAGTTSGLPIPEGKQAVSAQFSDPARVAGFVQPGSQVTVYATVAGKTTPVLGRADVIALGPSTTGTVAGASTNTEQVSRAIVTFALLPEDARTLVQAQAQGPLSLALLAPGPRSPSATPGTG